MTSAGFTLYSGDSVSLAEFTEDDTRSILKRLNFSDSVLNELSSAKHLDGESLVAMSGAELLAAIGSNTPQASEFVAILEELQCCGAPKSWKRGPETTRLSPNVDHDASNAAHWIECDRQYMLARCSNIEAQQWLQERAGSGCRIATAFVMLWHRSQDRADAAQQAAEVVHDALPVWLQSEDMTEAMYGQYIAGRCLQEGLGCGKDEVACVSWYRMASVQGLALAQLNLGYCYGNGIGVSRNPQRALTWYRMAADQGNALAQYNVAWFYEKGHGVAQDDVMAAEWYRRAAEQGYGDAQIGLADMYEEGRGVERDDALGAMWLRKAAEAGVVRAQVNYGFCCDYGQGVPVDYSAAVYWYRRAAEQGQSTAQFNLALRYSEGRGVARDEREASMWYLKAAEQGHARAQSEAAYRCEHGIGTMKDAKVAVMWWTKAAVQDHIEAQRNLGICYLNGTGVSKDRGVAMALLRTAADQGDEDAVGALLKMGEQHDDQLHRTIALSSSDSYVDSSGYVKPRNVV